MLVFVCLTGNMVWFSQLASVDSTSVQTDVELALAQLGTRTGATCLVTFTTPGVYLFSLRVTDPSRSTSVSNVTVWVPDVTSAPKIAPGKRCHPGFVCDIVMSINWLPLTLLLGGPRPGFLNGTLRYGLVTQASVPILDTNIDTAGSVVTVTDVNPATGSATISGQARGVA